MENRVHIPRGKHLASWKTQALAYGVVCFTCYAAFWFGLGQAALFYSLLVQFFLLPLAAFVLALLMGLSESWQGRQWFFLVAFGMGFLLGQYLTFTLANMISVPQFRWPEWENFLLGAAFALPGMALGSVVRWSRLLRRLPGDRRRSLWVFGIVWGCGVAVFFGMIVIPIILTFPLTLLELFLPSVFPSQQMSQWLSQGMHVVFLCGPCGIGGLAALGAGFALGHSQKWLPREKLRLLPLPGAAWGLSVVLGITVVRLWEISPFQVLCLAAVCMVVPGIGMLAGSLFAAKQKSGFFH